MTEEKKYVILRLTKDDIRNTIENDGNEKVIDYVSKANRQELEYLLQEGD